MLRRTKDEVARDLPAKQEQVLELELNPKHRKVYETHLQRERQKVLGLIDDVGAEPVRDLPVADHAAPAQPGRRLSTRSTRGSRRPSSTRCSSMLEDTVAEGHRTLIFSQFTRFLGKARDRLDAAGISYCLPRRQDPQPGQA